MKNLLIIIFCLWLVGCKDDIEYQEIKKNVRSQYEITCVEVGSARTTIYRCENSEVICYRRYEVGMQCKFKGDK